MRAALVVLALLAGACDSYSELTLFGNERAAPAVEWTRTSAPAAASAGYRVRVEVLPNCHRFWLNDADEARQAFEANGKPLANTEPHYAWVTDVPLADVLAFEDTSHSCRIKGSASRID